jgi:hypothetical protein
MIFSSQSFFVFSVADNSVFPVPVKSDEASPQNSGRMGDAGVKSNIFWFKNQHAGGKTNLSGRSGKASTRNESVLLPNLIRKLDELRSADRERVIPPIKKVYHGIAIMIHGKQGKSTGAFAVRQVDRQGGHAKFFMRYSCLKNALRRKHFSQFKSASSVGESD